MIEILEDLSKRIENMLTYPRMSANTAEALEMSLLTALGMWAIVIRLPQTEVHNLWRQEVVKAFPNDLGKYPTISYPTISLAGVVGESTQSSFPRIIKHMRNIWHKLKYGPDLTHEYHIAD